MFVEQEINETVSSRSVTQITVLSGSFYCSVFLEAGSALCFCGLRPSAPLGFRLGPRGWASLSPRVCTSVWLWCSSSCRQTPAGPPSPWGRRTPPADGGKRWKNKMFKATIIRSTGTVCHYTAENKTMVLKSVSSKTYQSFVTCLLTTCCHWDYCGF